MNKTNDMLFLFVWYWIVFIFWLIFFIFLIFFLLLIWWHAQNNNNINKLFIKKNFTRNWQKITHFFQKLKKQNEKLEQTRLFYSYKLDSKQLKNEIKFLSLIFEKLTQFWQKFTKQKKVKRTFFSVFFEMG